MQRSCEPFTPFDGWAYSLLLGFYLGDGCVASTGTSYQPRVILDGLYPGVIEACTMAITLSLVDEVNVRVRPRRTDRGVIVEASYKQWPEMLPQHGRGASTYAYPRYFFSNQSADIRGLFCEYCEKLGIRWTQSNPRNLSVSHRDSVARLDAFVGAKS